VHHRPSELLEFSRNITMASAAFASLGPRRALMDSATVFLPTVEDYIPVLSNPLLEVGMLPRRVADTMNNKPSIL